MKSSWKTSTAGILGILGGLTALLTAAQSGHLDMNSISAAIATIGAGIGLIFARDHDVSSEQAGVTPQQKAAVAGLSVALILSLGVLGITSMGCSSNAVTTAYKTETAIDTSVTTAWTLWQAYLVSNPTVPLNTQVEVISAFNKIKAAELVAIDATFAASTSTNAVSAMTSAVSVESQSLIDLGNLLAQFNIKL